jgi:hypothetical protein
MRDDLTGIREGLRRLRESAALLNVFGSQAHGFLTHAPLSEETVREFEVHHCIALPRDYRDFLIHVGNGGAGPAYGLFKLGEMDDGFQYRTWTENDGFVGVLSEPFPHTGPWNDLSGEPVHEEHRENDLEWEDEHNRQMCAWEEHVYWNTANVNGAIPICHLGCAFRQWLVVTGAETGNIWNDNRVDHDGLMPLQKRGRERVTFLEWYQFWLEEALRQLS